MSHIVSIQTEVHDPHAVATACGRLGIPEPVQGTATLFSGEATGLVIKFPDWLYPAVVDIATGCVSYDNYEGAWGDPNQIQRFVQIYVVEKAKLEARKKGYAVTEQRLQDESILVEIVEAG